MQTLDKPIWQILLIDDDEDDYLLTKSLLSETKGRECQLDWASSFKSGWQALEEKSYDVVLVDYDLGIPNGLELIRLFIAREYPTPFILLTGRGSYEVDMESMYAGATLYLTKSEVNPLLLERSIRYAIEHKEIQRALARANNGLLIQQRELQCQNELLREEIAERKRVEEAFLSKEAALRGVLDATKEAIWLFEPDGTILLGNETAFSRLKIPPEMALGKELNHLWPADIAQARFARLREVVETGQPVEFEDERSGFHFLHCFYPVKEIDGTVTGVAAFSRDITKMKQSENDLREQEEMFRLALTAGRAGAWSWDLKPGTLKWSDEYYSLFGYEPGSVEPSLEVSLNRIHPDDLPRIKEIAHELMEEGKQNDEVHRVIWPDGSIHWIRSISQGFYDEQGRLYRLAGLVFDKTEQKEAEIKLQAAHQRTIEILESIGDAFYSIDEQFCFTYVNRRAGILWGKDPEDLIGKQIWNVFPMFLKTEAYPKINQAMRDRRPDQFETYSEFLDQWVDVHLYPTDHGLSVYFQDITRRKQMEQDLRKLGELR